MKPGIRANMTWAMYSGPVSGSTVPSACGRHRRSGRGAQVSGGLEQASPGGFDIRAVPDRVAAVKAIEDRDVYGAIVLDPQNAEVLTALGRWSRSRADPGATACTAGRSIARQPAFGLASAPEMLPSGWGAPGQLLPPGAAGTALRSVAFFDGAGAGRPLLVLSCWFVGGLLLCRLGALHGRSRRGVQGRREASPVTA
jgi:hypothetical protein